MAERAGTIWAELESWRPLPSWAPVMARAAARLEQDRGAVPGWADLAMMLGDSRAEELALIVCLHAERLPGAEKELSRIAAHRDLCLLHLGLTPARRPGLIPIVKLGDPDVLAVSKPKLERWLARRLGPFEGDLESAAEYVLQLALSRAGLRTGDPPLQ